jgi:hypothetical protein
MAQTSPGTPEAAKANEWLRQVQQIHLSKDIQKYDLLDPPHTDLPAALMDTLAKYDWVEVGSLWYEDVVFSDGFNEVKTRYNFTRFDADGTMNEYLGGKDSTGVSFSIKTTVHNIPWKMTVSDTLRHTWLCWDAEDCMRLVSYEDGILMYDLYDGMETFGDIRYPRRYRTVCIAVPKMF